MASKNTRLSDVARSGAALRLVSVAGAGRKSVASGIPAIPQHPRGELIPSHLHIMQLGAQQRSHGRSGRDFRRRQPDPRNSRQTSAKMPESPTLLAHKRGNFRRFASGSMGESR
jgi:hypothetical protein